MKKSGIILLFTISFIYPERPSVKVGGFVRMDSATDTRQGVAGPDCSCYIYPKKIECDDQCGDINARGNFIFTPAVTRLRISADSPEMKNVNISGLIELDFYAYCSDIYGITRMRHAFLKAEWENKSLLVGQYWHPIYPMRCFADTVSFNGGTPIETYARYPQIRFDWHKGALGAKLTAYSQYQFTDKGPDGSTPFYMQNSMTPGLFGAVEIRKPRFFAGAGVNMQRLLPALSTTTTSTNVTKRTYVSTDKLTSLIGTLYCSFDIKKFLIKTKIAVGQNGYSFGTLGGYAVNCLNPTTGKRCFENINFASWWGELVYRKYQKIHPAIFVGITRNLGTSHNKCIYRDDNENPIFYGYDSEIHQVLRISPRIKSSFNYVHIGVEADFTKAWYGKMNAYGEQKNTYPTSNMRILVATWYAF